jgi:hypothetical protein
MVQAGAGQGRLGRSREQLVVVVQLLRPGYRREWRLVSCQSKE